MRAKPARAGSPGIARPSLTRLLATLIGLKLLILFVFAWQSRFVMDEFVFLGHGKYLFGEVFESFWPVKALGYAIFFKIAHVIAWDATSLLLIGRLQTALLGCGTLALVYACAREIGEDRPRSLAIVLITLSFSNFMERIFRTIAEPVALFFAAAALLAVVRSRDRGRGAILLAGVLSGLAFLATQKAVYFNVALGLALVGDAALAGRYADGVRRGAWLVLGWTVPIIAYCVSFGGPDPLPIAHSLFVGPTEIAFRGGGEYGGLRRYVVQFLVRNAVLAALCFAGLLLSLRQVRQLPETRRIALLFSLVITALVFAHDQPWPYVFIMALPFMALWALVPIDRLAGNAGHRLGWAVLAFAVALSFVGNARYLAIDNRTQLELVARAEALLAPDETYFDGIAMLPNRSEPSTLWLDRHFVFRTLREGTGSEAYAIVTRTPPKLILWSYRMRDISPVVGPAIDDSYTRVAPNIRLAGQRLVRGERVTFDVPVAGAYRLYDAAGRPVPGAVSVDGAAAQPRVVLARGRKSVELQSGPPEALLVPEGSYTGVFDPRPDDPELFARVYD